MTDNTRVTLKVMENVSDMKIKYLLDELKKIAGFEFGVDAFIKTSHDQNQI